MRQWDLVRRSPRTVRLTVLIVLVASSLIATACGSSSTTSGTSSGSKGNLVTIKIASGPYLDYQPWTLAHELGYDKQQGLNLEITNFTVFNTGMSEMARGDANAVVSCNECNFPLYKSIPTLANWLITNQFKGFIVVGRSGHTQTYDQLAAKVGPAQAKRQILMSFRGKTFVMDRALRIGIIEGGISQVGLPPSAIKIANFSSDAQGAFAFLRGTGDYYIGALPQEAKLLFSSGGQYVNVGGEGLLGPAALWYSTMAATQPWLSANQSVVYKLMAVWYRTMKYIAEKPAQAWPILTNSLNSASKTSFSVAKVKFLGTTLNGFFTLDQAKSLIYNPSSPLYWRNSVRYYAKAAGSTLPSNFDVNAHELEEHYFTNFQNQTALVNWVNSPL